jgi:hypothetical protein
VGRPDLARRHLARLHARRALLSIGASLMIAAVAGLATGVALSTSQPSCVESDPRTHTCVLHGTNEAAFYGGLYGGLGGIQVGAAVMIGGLVLRAQPTSSAEARELADDYNRQLRRDLGLPPSPASRSPAGAVNFALAPSLSPTSAGLSFALVF